MKIIGLKGKKRDPEAPGPWKQCLLGDFGINYHKLKSSVNSALFMNAFMKKSYLDWAGRWKERTANKGLTKKKKKKK